jgi:hypothetical protein
MKYFKANVIIPEDKLSEKCLIVDDENQELPAQSSQQQSIEQVNEIEMNILEETDNTKYETTSKFNYSDFMIDGVDILDWIPIEEQVIISESKKIIIKTCGIEMICSLNMDKPYNNFMCQMDTRIYL